MGVNKFAGKHNTVATSFTRKLRDELWAGQWFMVRTPFYSIFPDKMTNERNQNTAIFFNCDSVGMLFDLRAL